MNSDTEILPQHIGLLSPGFHSRTGFTAPEREHLDRLAREHGSNIQRFRCPVTKAEVYVVGEIERSEQ